MNVTFILNLIRALRAKRLKRKTSVAKKRSHGTSAVKTASARLL